MNLSPTEQILQLAAWFLSAIEFILAFYILLLNARHTANRHVSAILLVFAANSLAIGQLIGAATVNDAIWSAPVLAATSPIVEPALLLAAIALLRPEWMRGRARAALWPVYALAMLPVALTAVDVLFGTRLYYTGVDPNAYAGGFLNLSDYTAGSLAPALRGVSIYIFGLVTLIPIAYILWRERRGARRTRGLAWLLFFAHLSAVAVAFGLQYVLQLGASVLLSSTIYVIAYAYAGFQQMISERRLQRGRIQARLTSLILIIVLPLLVSIVGSLSSQSGARLEADALEQLRLTQRVVSERLATWLDLNVKALQQTAVLPDIVSLDAERQRTALKALAGAHPYMYLASTTDVSGINLARSDDAAPVDYGDREWFVGARSNRLLTFETLVGRASGQPELVVATPIRDATGRTIGVIMFAADLAGITREIQLERIGDTGLVYVVDARDRVVAHTDPAFSAELRSLSDYAPVVRMRQNPAAPFSFTDENGQTWRASTVQLGNGWGVVAQQTEAELLSDLNLFRGMAGFILIGGVSLLFILSRLAIRQAMRPIGTLTATATAIGAGDLNRTAPIESDDEFGTLAQVLNGMTARLRDLVGTLEAQVEARTAQLKASAEVGRAAASILNPDQLLREVVNLISERFGFYYAAVFLVEDSGSDAVLREATGEAGRVLKERGHKLEVGGQSMVGTVTLTRQPRIALDVGAEAVRFANPLLPETRSEIALPLVVGERVLGALDVQSRQEAAFDEASAATLQTMADQIAVALTNAALFAQSQHSIQTLNDLLTMARDLAASRTLPDLTRRARQHLESILGVDTYYLALVDDQQTEIQFVLQRRSDGGVEDQTISRPFGSGPGLAEYVIRSRRPLRIHASEANARMAQLGISASPQTPRAYIGVPLIAGSRVLGVLGLQDFSPDAAFSDDQEKLAIALANQIGVMVENLRLVDETRNALADLDAANRLLTGRAWERFSRSGTLLAGEWRGGQWLPAATDAPAAETPGGRVPSPAPAIRFPVKVRGEAIGEFALSPSDDVTWTSEDFAFAQMLIDQVAQAIETTRLLEETERLAGRERLINTINSRVRQTVNVDAILQTAVSELGRSLNAARVLVRIGGREAAAGDTPAGGGPDTGNGRGDDHV